tara:strand:+ start:316 stop:531 length:216 start_codon:yes stop_codon:yes gene_type:complete
MENNYTKELRKDIKIIKKDLRSMNIKTRSLYRELEKNNFIVTTVKKSKNLESSTVVWWKRIINKIFGTNLK